MCQATLNAFKDIVYNNSFMEPYNHQLSKGYYVACKPYKTSMFFFIFIKIYLLIIIHV